MEGIEAEIKEKLIERSGEGEMGEIGQSPTKLVIKEQVIEKPKKERTQAQKDAFEKARKKRAENLAKKKELEAQTTPEPLEVMKQNQIEKPKKKRGRPRKPKMVVDEPPLQQFIPPQPINPTMPYHVQGQQFNPYHYPLPIPQTPVQPVNNYYYYGTPPPSAPQEKEEPKPELDFVGEAKTIETNDYNPDEETDEEVEYELPPDPRLKFRFG